MTRRLCNSLCVTRAATLSLGVGLMIGALGCGGDPFRSADGTPDASAGSGGSSGDGGSGGASGTGGEGGTSGTGGSAGMGGSGGSGGSVGSGGMSGAGGTGTEEGGLADGGACDPTEPLPDAVFASADDGDDGMGDGTASRPVRSVGKAIAIAVTTGRRVVLLDAGTYSEMVKLEAQHGGLTVSGGWQKVGAAWQRDCATNARDKTLLSSPSTTGLSVQGVTTTVVFRTLTVQAAGGAAPAANQPGASCYGAMVVDSSLSLEDVVVKACRGGRGGEANAPVASQPPDCSNLTPMHCANGADGTPGNAGASAAESGMYGPTGYQPSRGGDGTPGGNGQNGTAGGFGETQQCYGSGCSGGGGQCSNLLFCGNLIDLHAETSQPGKCGCGGRGGAGGAGGPGGGGSFGIYAVGSNTVVNLVASWIEAADGGNGSAGQPGSFGSPGGPGVAGAPATCSGRCVPVDTGGGQCNCEQPETTSIAGGAKGGNGGKGGDGGPGGGGSGGPSIAVLRFDGAKLIRDNGSSLVFGEPGEGGDAAAADGDGREVMAKP
jgi:hypothetical protein